MKFSKSILYFFLLFILVSSVKGQVVKYKQFHLKNFGVITLPTILDTIGQRLQKDIKIEQINEIKQNKLKAINNIYHLDLTKTILINTVEGTYRFWNSSTLNYFIDTVITILAKNDNNINKIDFSKIELIPNISLRKDISPVNSSYILKNVFSNPDSTSTFLKLIESMLKNIKKTFSDSKVIETISGYSLIENKYPLVKASCLYSSADNTKYIITFIFFYKENFKYSMKFEYKNDDNKNWIQYMYKFLTTMKLF